MNSAVYLVFFWDGFIDSSDFMDAVFFNQQDAIDYASEYDLAHGESITVEERLTGISPHGARYPAYVYKRTHYDHTEVLFREICLVCDCDHVLSYQEVVETAINNYSPICVNIDWHRLFLSYLQHFDGDYG